jgi:addiction module HigA family antidote
MTESQSLRRDWAIPPGEILQEALAERSMSQSELARRMDRPVKTINEIVNAKTAVTPETALQLELALGIPARVWTRLESAYREQRAREQAEAELSSWIAWAKKFPVNDLVRNGLLERPEGDSGLVAGVLSFFGVSTVSAWEREWSALATSYRQSETHEAVPESQAAWLRWGELEAAKREASDFDSAAFRGLIPDLRSLTRKEPTLGLRRAQELCATAGVTVIFVPELPGARVSGATRWLTPRRPLIQLSERHKIEDQIWFTFFHEAGHVVGDQRTEFLDLTPDGEPGAEPEERANQLARDWLIDPTAYATFVAAQEFAVAAIRDFASSQDISPGIVVGRLQRDGLVDHSKLNHLKRRFNFAR